MAPNKTNICNASFLQMVFKGNIVHGVNEII